MNITWPFRTKANPITAGDQASDIDDSLDKLFQDMALQAAALKSYKIDLSNDVTSALAVSRLAASGTPSATTFLRGDGSWSPALSAVNSPTPYARKFGYILANPATSFAVGCTERINPVVYASDLVGSYVDLNSAASGAELYWGTSHTVFLLDHNPTYIARVKTGADITNVILWFGFYNGANFNGVNTMLAAGTGIRYSTTVPDGGFVGASFDGVAQVTTATIAPIAANTIYYIRVDVTGNGALASFTISDSNNVQLGTKTLSTRIKTNQTMRPTMLLSPQVASSRHMFPSVFYFEYNP